MAVEEKQNVIEMVSGDNASIPIECRNPENDNVVDISSFVEIVFTMWDGKKRILVKKLSAGELRFLLDPPDGGTDGRVDILMAKKDTYNLKGTFKFDLQFTDADGVITTPVRSFINILEDYSK